MIGGRRFCILASTLTVTYLLLASCAPMTTPTPTSKPTAAPSKVETPSSARAPTPVAPSPTPKPGVGQPKYGGVLTAALAAEPASFDIHQESGGQHSLLLPPVYNGLLQYDPLAWPEEKVVADVAESWVISPDGLEYTFRLRSGVKWHDGKPFTSDDVKGSLDRVRNPTRGMRSPRQASFQSIAQVDAVAPDALRIRLRNPSASLLSNLAIDWLAILPKHVIEAKGDMKRDILGTGPFKFKGYTPGTTYEYVKNAEYFVRGRPYLDGMVMYLIKDPATRFAALRTARVLYLPFPYGISVSQAKLAKEDPNVVVQTNWRPTLYVLNMNLQKSPWSDPRVRRAASLAIDRQAFITTVLEDGGLVGAQMASKGLWGISEDELLKMPGYRQPKDADIAEARRLVAEAGFPQGFTTSITVRADEVYQRQGTFVLAELAKLGIKGELATKLTAAFDEALARGAYDTMCLGIATALDDPDLRFGENYVTGAGRNYGKYSNPKIDELYDKQSRALDVVERKRLVREMLTILQQDNPDVAMAWGVTYIAHDSRVRNYRIGSGPQVNNRLQEVWLGN